MPVKKAKRPIRKKKKTKRQLLALPKFERRETKAEIRKPKKNLSPKLAQKANKPITYEAYTEKIVDISQNLTKLSLDQSYNLLRRVTKETRQMRQLFNRVGVEGGPWKYKERHDILLEFEKGVSAQFHKKIIERDNPQTPTPSKPLRPKTRNRPNQRIPKATIAKKRYDQHAGIRGLIGSSFIHYLEYNPDTKIVTVRLGANNYHTESQVPEKVFLDWKAGKASCITKDTSSLKRWKVGKTPSLGAFFNKYIKGKYNLVRGLA